MDPWLEDPALSPDVHNRLISAIADASGKLVTLIELLSPANKVLGKGRHKYIKKMALGMAS